MPELQRRAASTRHTRPHCTAGRRACQPRSLGLPTLEMSPSSKQCMKAASTRRAQRKEKTSSSPRLEGRRALVPPHRPLPALSLARSAPVSDLAAPRRRASGAWRCCGLPASLRLRLRSRWRRAGPPCLTAPRASPRRSSCCPLAIRPRRCGRLQVRCGGPLPLLLLLAAHPRSRRCQSEPLSATRIQQRCCRARAAGGTRAAIGVAMLLSASPDAGCVASLATRRGATQPAARVAETSHGAAASPCAAPLAAVPCAAAAQQQAATEPTAVALPLLF